ncbi:MFS transporter [Lyngbya aestuarii]|uniref:MFS transporter n=1 Tax=Lyngbya aestuarii TaxID=118322 RepID=UPI00403D60A7
MKVFQTLGAERRQNLLILFAAGLLFWSSLASMLPTLPPYIEDMGATKQQLGIVMGCFAIGLLLSRTTLGNLADQHSRKLVLVIGTLVVAIAPLGYLLVDSIGLLMLIRVFHGISLAAFTTGYIALVTDLSPVHQRGELIGYMSLVTPIGLGLGPALGGFLLVETNYPTLFLVSGGLGLLGMLCACQVKENKRSEVDSQGNSQPSWKNFWQLLSSPRLRIPALVLLLAGLSFGAISTFVALFIRETGVDFNPGLYFSAAAVFNFMARFFIGRASDRFGRGVFISGSLVFYGLAMFLLAHAQSPQGFLLASIAQGIGAGTLLPMMIALISDRSSPNERGRVFSVSISGFDLGIALAGPIFGSLADLLGYRGIFSITIGLIVLALMIFITQCSKNFSHSLRFATGQERDTYALDNQA